MSVVLRWLVPAAVIGVMAGVGAVRAAELPPGGRPVFEDTLSALGTFENERGRAEVVSVDGPGFDGALRIASNQVGESWDLQAQAGLPKPVREGETLVLTFWARTVRTDQASGHGVFRAAVGEASPPWSKSLSTVRRVGREWRRFVLPFAARDDYEPGRMMMALEVGGAVQALDFGAVELLSYGDRVEAGELPETATTYPGRAPDAEWRAEAERRIRRVRTAPVTIRVTDAEGRPVEGAEVRVRMTRHGFHFGCAFRAWHAVDDSERARFYRRKIPELFNAVSFTNALKWPPWAGDWGEEHSRQTSLSALRWVQEQGLWFRGHVLVWPSWGHLPRYMRKYREDPDPEVIRREVLEHIDSITTATRGFVSEWDVINEPYSNHDLMDVCGREVMVDWFERAHRNVPEAALALNDYGILTALADSPHQRDYEETVRYLIEEGAPIGVLGMQGHFGETAPAPSRVLATLDRFAEFDLPIRVTEFTVGGDDRKLEADWTRDCLTLVFSHPAVVGFQFWGPGQLFTSDGNEKPNLRAYRELVFDRWWTDRSGRAGADGEFATRGFLGAHRVEVSRGGRTGSAEFELAEPGEEVVVEVMLR
ncbi:MAG: endo-1,4-beta-xylanase [Planctomycetota bacterium]